MKNNKESNVKYYYIRDNNNNPIACVATVEIVSGPREGQVRFALSVKNPMDNFKRSQARGIAETRVLTLPDIPRIQADEKNYSSYSINDFGGYLPSEGFTKRGLLQTIIKNSKIPSRARRAAKQTIDYFDYTNSVMENE